MTTDLAREIEDRFSVFGQVRVTARVSPITQHADIHVEFNPDYILREMERAFRDVTAGLSQHDIIHRAGNFSDVYADRNPISGGVLVTFRYGERNLRTEIGGLDERRRDNRQVRANSPWTVWIDEERRRARTVVRVPPPEPSSPTGNLGATADLVIEDDIGHREWRLIERVRATEIPVEAPPQIQEEPPAPVTSQDEIDLQVAGTSADIAAPEPVDPIGDPAIERDSLMQHLEELIPLLAEAVEEIDGENMLHAEIVCSLAESRALMARCSKAPPTVKANSNPWGGKVRTVSADAD